VKSAVLTTLIAAGAVIVPVDVSGEVDCYIPEAGWSVVTEKLLQFRNPFGEIN
jgi:hypothetical protein